MTKTRPQPKPELNPQNVFFRCVEDSNDAIMISNPEGILSYVNPAWSRIYGYSREEAIGQSPRILHSGIHSPEFYREMWGKIQDPAVAHWKGELVNRTKDGSLVPVLLTITPFREASGELSGFMGIAVDTSYKRELEAKVAHQDRLASIGLLASGLAHEIGTPLGVIRGRAEFLLSQTDNTALTKSLEVITAQTDRISKLIRSLLRTSRSHSDVGLEDISPQGAVENILNLIGQNFSEEGIGLQVDIPETIRVRADHGRLEQALLNLMMNSLHAMKRAKAMGREGPHLLRISCRRLSPAQVTLTVEDTGCGIAPEDMKKLFKPFFTTKDVGEGTGLGLAIVAQLVQEMEGKISAQSTPAKGSAFTIELKGGAGY